jgi:hypothetical protein
MKTRQTLALILIGIITAGVLASSSSLAQDRPSEGAYLVMANLRSPPLTGAVSPTNPYRREPLWIRFEDISSIRPATGPHVGHTALSMSNGRMHYTVVVWGTPEAWAEVWAANTGRGVLSVE